MNTKCLKYILLCLCMTLSSCKLHTSGNGDLDGFWQGTTMENLETGELSDMRENNITWSVQGDLLVMRSHAEAEGIIWRFDLTDNVLHIYEPYYSRRFAEEGTDVPVEDVADLIPYGISELEEYFKVLELDGNTMRLESMDVRLTFRKY